jgi:hypothetical protein
MKKYFFVLSFLAILATVACDTSSKASTTQTVAAQPQSVAAPTAIVADTMAVSMPAKKAFSKKAVNMQRAEMTLPEKTAAGAPVKN